MLARSVLPPDSAPVRAQFYRSDTLSLSFRGTLLSRIFIFSNTNVAAAGTFQIAIFTLATGTGNRGSHEDARTKPKPG